MTFVDTNIIIRFVTNDDPVKGPACARFFGDVRDGKEEAATCEAVVTEAVYVLSSVSYRMNRSDIRKALAPVASLKRLRLPYRRSYLRALDLYVAHPQLDFEDALRVAHMERRGIREILSYDRDLSRVSTITRREPRIATSCNGSASPT